MTLIIIYIIAIVFILAIFREYGDMFLTYVLVGLIGAVITFMIWKLLYNF